MSDVLQGLVELLEPTEIGENTFRGETQDLGFRALFGGQVMAQSLSSALKTLPEGEWHAHSFHVYFMLAGTVTDHLEFEVDRLRDGRTFCTRQVKAMQNGRAILTMICSFQQTEEGFEHQAAMPEVKGPDGIPSQVELARMFRDYFPEKVRDIYTADKPIEMRVLDPVNIFAPTKKDPVKYLWMKADGSLPEDTDLHAKLLAYASDFNLLPTSLHPHARSYGQKGMQMASLDHSVWFHRPFRMDEWLLYAIDSPNAGGGRGFCRGQVFNQKGELVASVAQEGLIRYREPEEKS
ncbi:MULTISPECIES: acyl-CoA thioesterase [Thalassolituus]|uniref:Acyl-CoA thioesterase 2 n=1 Tax=Thalassolituus maritimus TaxID=484498 RepID=A0A1N7PQZ2_9GAMM|nr:MULTISPECIES: acyl-CoA thioesterase II [Thalassolituus]MAX87862.1 acyl-CoA thioesterase II [Oceanospirillaceae bacterium]TPD53885.1 MAG: acyl-CoA thioesterase II [Thalassolituus maritimus]SIT12996.1 acyl-CoA thioesterase-2 [Thalassolituus maritimus]|tara:strand:- start:15607 stop:16485 length:879 start_codon:yes stop_codon:yes gene_type:complete